MAITTPLTPNVASGANRDTRGPQAESRHERHQLGLAERPVRFRLAAEQLRNRAARGDIGDEASVRAQHTAKLAEDRRLVMPEIKRVAGQHGIDAGVVQRQPVEPRRRDRRAVAAAATGDLDHQRAVVDAGHARARPRDRCGRPARAAAEIQHMLPRSRRERGDGCGHRPAIGEVHRRRDEGARPPARPRELAGERGAISHRCRSWRGGRESRRGDPRPTPAASDRRVPSARAGGRRAPLSLPVEWRKSP